MQGNHPRIVVVEDDDLVRSYFEDILTADGYECSAFSGCSQALDHLGSPGTAPDLILSDINMPGMTGLDFLRASRNIDSTVPFILVSGSYELPLAMDALGNGATDYLLKPASTADILALVGKHAGRRERPVSPALQEGIDSWAATHHLAALSQHSPGGELAALLQSLSAKRIETREHSDRVTAFALRLGRELRLSDEALNLKDLELGALLHDIGKLGVPENVLRKPGPLNAEEWRVMKLHPVIGYEMLSSFPGFAHVTEIVHRHHEAFDGSGYPSGLAGAEIPLGARIFSVVDTYDAITSARPYRAAAPDSVARVEIAKNSGLQFDPVLVRCFLDIPIKDLDAIRHAPTSANGK